LRLEIWDKLQCAGGAVLAVVPDVVALTWVDSKDGLSSLTGQLPVDSPAFSSFGTSRILRICWQDETFAEWVIQDLTPSQSADGKRMVAFVCASLDTLLNQVLLRQTFADGTITTDFELVGLTPIQWIDNVILTSAAADGLSWLARGVIEATLALDFTFAAESVRSFLGRLATNASTMGTTYEYRLRQNGVTGYLIDLLAGIGRGAIPLDLRNRRNLVTLSRKSTRTGQVTRCSAQGTAIDGIHPTIARARWKVLTTPSGTTATLGDPLGGDGPIAFDSQLVLPTARYVRKIGGSLLLLTASAAATQQITTSGAHGWSVNDLVEFALDSAGTDLTYLEHPTKVQAPTTGYGMITAMLDRPDLAGTINAVTDPCFRNFPSSPGVPTNYELVGGMGSANVSRVTTANRWQSGGQSARLQTAADGQGLGCLYETLTPAPSAAKPYVSGFIDFYNDATGSAVRAELVLGKATTAISGTPTRATSGGVTTVTVTTSGAHGFLNDDQIEHTGATPAGGGPLSYNGIKTIKVVDATHYTFTLTTDPGAPGGTWVARKVWVFPDSGVEYSSVVKAWDTLGIAGIDANALAATVMKIRLVQHGDTNADVYLDAVQMTQASAQEPFLEGCGANRLWQACNRKLSVFSDPLKVYDVQILDLNRLDPTTWPWDSVVLGGSAVVTHSDLGIADTVRIVEIERQLTSDKVTDTRVKLATRADEFTDIPAPRTLRQNDAQPGGFPIGVSAAIVPLATDPNTVSVTLTPAPPGALVYYWAGQYDQKPPQIGQLTGTNVYSTTQWGRYSAAFTLARSATGDLRVWAYAVTANRASAPQGFQVTRALSSAVVLTLSQIAAAGAASNMKISWAVDTNVRSVQVYYKRVASPGGVAYPTIGGLVGGVLDTAAQYLGEFYTTADGIGVGGILSGAIGTPVAGALSFTIATAFGTNDWLAVILVPIDRQGNVGTRVSATLQCAGTTPSSIATFTQGRTSDGTVCDTAGAVFHLAWTEGGTAWSDGTHDLALSYQYQLPGGGWTGWIAMTTITTPHSTTSYDFTSLHKKTTAKFDPNVTYQFKAELIVSAGPTIIDTATVTATAFTSSCVPV
jgi:hypothetical protein